MLSRMNAVSLGIGDWQPQLPRRRAQLTLREAGLVPSGHGIFVAGHSSKTKKAKAPWPLTLHYNLIVKYLPARSVVSKRFIVNILYSFLSSFRV